MKRVLSSLRTSKEFSSLVIAIRIVIATAFLVFLGAQSFAMTLEYEGTAAHRIIVNEVFDQLLKEYPRVEFALGDFPSIKLNMSNRETPGLFGLYAQALNADTLLVVTFQVSEKPSVMPSGTMRPGSKFTIIAENGPDYRGVLLPSPAAQWLCKRTPAKNEDVTKFTSSEIYRLVRE